MASPMTENEVRTSTDVDALWQAFLAARREGDGAAAERIRARMAELQEQQSLQELDDDQLLARIAHLKEQEDEDHAVVDLTGTPPGPVARLSAMIEEASRRGL